MMPRRFIAGAVCPRCAQMDKVVMYDNEAGQRVRECISCGYRDALDERGNPTELETRVNQPRAGEKPLPHEDEVRVIHILDVNSGSKRRDH
ncbi:MAG TPA: YheV family putative zinc ribbon protein [Spongiibacteraceae bacterium]|nr:YheV family putative zinc ribbon protein [Spongiibacteraceae bacterium]